LACPVLHQMAVLHQQVHQVLLRKQPGPQQQQQNAARSVIPAPATAQLTVPLFSRQELESVLDAVQIVRFGQRVQLPGCFGISAEARPSGSGIGSCMWLMTCGDQRYVSGVQPVGCRGWCTGHCVYVWAVLGEAKRCRALPKPGCSSHTDV
jgi:hypothetical protein